MSRVTKWKLEKTKVKVVFRLQFHATHIPQSGWDKLFISFISIDSGKTISKTTKANARNGTCKWADPIYETTSLLIDVKSKQYDDKLYKFVLAMGSSRSSILGEAAINLSDYADASRPSTIPLPLQGCSSGAVLHVTVQLLTSKTGFREFEQQRDLRDKGLLASNDPNRHVEPATNKIFSAEENLVTAGGKFRPESKELPSLEEEGLTDEYSDSALGLDASSNTSGSLYAEKHDTSSMHEVESLKSTLSGDFNGLSAYQGSQKERGELSDSPTLIQRTNDLTRGCGSSYSIDDLATTHEENSRLKGNLEAAESSIVMLKLEVNSLQNHANEISKETQKFNNQLSAEMASCKDLTEKVFLLKLECTKFRDDLEQLKVLKASPQFTSRESRSAEHEHSSENIQVKWGNGLLILEDRIKELQKRAGLGFHERDLSFLHPEFEALLSIVHSLKQGNGEVMAQVDVSPLGKPNEKETRELNIPNNERFVSGNNFNDDLCQPDSKFQFVGIPGHISQDLESVTAVDVMKEKMFELLRELDASKIERESLAKKMDQMECYYEALIQELEENQRRILGELQNLKNEHSTCLYAISTSKAETELLHHDMDQQSIKFTQMKHDLDVLNMELEKRAMTSEAALRRGRLNYSIAVDQLQKDLELLSSQVVSMFETNESLIKQAFSETSPTGFQNHLDIVQNECSVNNLILCQNDSTCIRRRHVGGDIFFEDLKKSLCYQEELYCKVEGELGETHSVNLYLDMLSTALLETLYEVSAHIRIIEEKNKELGQHLDLTTESKNLLTARLQIAMNDIHILNNDKTACVSKYSDLVNENLILNTNLETTTKENCVLEQKIAELEGLLKACRSFESKYEVCCAEKMELSILLRQGTLENGNLESEVACLKQKLTTLQAELDDLASSKESLQKIIISVEDMLCSLFTSYKTQFHGIFTSFNFSGQGLEFKDFKAMFWLLEEIQSNAFQRIHELMEEKKELQDEKNIAEKYISTVRSESVIMKRSIKNDMQKMVAKLDLSEALVEKLQLELESISKKFKISSEIEEKHAQQNVDLLADLNNLELKLQKLTSKSGEFAQEILGFETLTEEFGKSKSTIADLLQDKQTLIISLQGKGDEIDKLVSEVDHLKDSMGHLHGELHLERSLREKLESKVVDLAAQLNEKHDQLLDFDQKKSELEHFRKLVLNLQVEISGVNHVLLQRENSLERLQEQATYVDVLESQLLDMHKLLIAENVNYTYLQTQYQSLVDNLTQQLQSSDGNLMKLQKQHLDMKEKLSRCCEDESHYIEENKELLTKFECLKSELESSISQNCVLSCANDTLAVEFKEFKIRLAVEEAKFSEDIKRYDLEIKHLQHVLASLEEEITFMIQSKIQVDITAIVLKAKLYEHHVLATELEQCNDELSMLRKHCSELARELSEQTLKTEEFENLTIHLNELKDKAEADCRAAQEKKERDVPSTAIQESLRIVFIKEQYETKLQELRQQISVSKKHGEEMLRKLQDAVNETENRKKVEVSHLKKNEELALKILELEGELQLLLSDKREKIKGYDRIKTELECALLSLECCKEEKEKLKTSFQECEKERSQVVNELTSMKEQLENSALPICFEKEAHVSDEFVVRKVLKETSFIDTHSLDIVAKGVVRTGSVENSPNVNANQESVMNNDVKDVTFDEMSCLTLNTGQIQNCLVSNAVDGNSEPKTQGTFSSNDSEHLATINDGSIIQSVRTSFTRLHEELERMKSENSNFSQNYHLEQDFQDLQGELAQLHKTNEELHSIYPLFNEVSSGGNALERVLALEIELAEALRAKNKSSNHFQSSFLRQHSDEEAIFKSFKDINELIKDMLDIKSRYSAVETELKEMHDRYSQLSLQFAEVEGERQKLMMTLKNVRSSKKLMHLNRSSSATVTNHPS